MRRGLSFGNPVDQKLDPFVANAVSFQNISDGHHIK